MADGGKIDELGLDKSCQGFKRKTGNMEKQKKNVLGKWEINNIRE